MLRPRLNISVDDERGLIVVRYIGELDSDIIKADLVDGLLGLEAPWKYDVIIDESRFSGFLPSDMMEEMCRQWNEANLGRDRGRCLAIVSADAFTLTRVSVLQAIFPQRVVQGFVTTTEAEAWVALHRCDDRATKSA